LVQCRRPSYGRWFAKAGANVHPPLIGNAAADVRFGSIAVFGPAPQCGPLADFAKDRPTGVSGHPKAASR
jgi:hypothetical protein